MELWRKRKHTLPCPKPKLPRTTAWKCYQKQQRLTRLHSRMKKISSDIKEISEEQRDLKSRQRALVDKFESLDFQYDQLQKETQLILQQSSRTQIRLSLMFQILKARENMEFDKAAMLTAALRGMIEREGQEMNG